MNYSNYHLDRVHQSAPVSGRTYTNSVRRPSWHLDSFKASIMLKMNREMVGELLNLIEKNSLTDTWKEIFHELKNFAEIVEAPVEVIINEENANKSYIVGKYDSTIFLIFNHDTLKELADTLSMLSSKLLASTYSLKQKAEKILYGPPFAG